MNKKQLELGADTKELATLEAKQTQVLLPHARKQALDLEVKQTQERRKRFEIATQAKLREIHKLLQLFKPSKPEP
jgi:hypothetical protein